MSYRVGQLVKCVNVDGDTTGLGVGSVSIITRINEHAGWPITAYDLTSDDDGYATEVAYSESEIEPFEGRLTIKED